MTRGLGRGQKNTYLHLQLIAITYNGYLLHPLISSPQIISNKVVAYLGMKVYKKIRRSCLQRCDVLHMQLIRDAHMLCHTQQFAYSNRSITCESRDVNETFSFETETRQRPSILASIRDRDLSRPRPRLFLRCPKWYSLLSFWLQTATNYAVFRSFITRNSSVSTTVLQKLSRHFPNFLKLLLCIVLHSCTCTMY